jgi:hypothetical protein
MTGPIVFVFIWIQRVLTTTAVTNCVERLIQIISEPRPFFQRMMPPFGRHVNLNFIAVTIMYFPPVSFTRNHENCSTLAVFGGGIRRRYLAAVIGGNGRGLQIPGGDGKCAEAHWGGGRAAGRVNML